MSLDELRQLRLAKIAHLRERGVNPYPERFARTHTLAAARALPVGTLGVAIAGRLKLIKKMGKLTFAWLHDVEGAIQISLRINDLPDGAYALFGESCDEGDFIGVTGELYTTKTGELTLKVATWTFLGKAVLPMPEKWHGLADPETCYRQRYLDLVSSDETKRRFLLRSRVVAAIRRVLDRAGFLEVDTPVLCDKPSGALARPFLSHHNALDMPVVMRIAPETYLKRCVVGGFDRVYEFARCFRNEGIDASHLQDFTMLEFYASYWSYEDNMRFTEELIEEVATAVLGSTSFEREGHAISFARPYPRASFSELILRDSGIELAAFPTADALRAEIHRRNLPLDRAEIAKLGLGNLTDQLYKKVSRPKLVQPTFLTGHPIELSPLARRNDTNPTIADRFQLVVAGWEVVNAYSELVDPVDQRARLVDQAQARTGGDEEAMPLDEDYLLAMEHGMPPISGWGMGIDRFVALLAGVHNLKDVVLFPLLRPLRSEEPSAAEA